MCFSPLNPHKWQGCPSSVRYVSVCLSATRLSVCVSEPLSLVRLLRSKMTQDNRVESPIPILPLSTPDVETEKLIKMKDEEVGRSPLISMSVEVLIHPVRN